jgi:hypothetical protein
MIIKRIGKKVPTKKTLHDGEAVVVHLNADQLLPGSEGGKFLYVRVGDELLRTKLEQVEWES